MKKEIFKGKNGAIYEVDKIPSKMFEFFIMEKREFKDGTKLYDIGVSPTADTTKGFVFKHIRGNFTDAEKELDKIIVSYKT